MYLAGMFVVKASNFHTHNLSDEMVTTKKKL